MVNVMSEGQLETKQVYKLLQCVIQKNKLQVQKMLRSGVPDLINRSEPNNGTCALHLASRSNDLDTAHLLLSLGACPDIKDKKGQTAMMLAAELGHVRMVELLGMNQASATLVDNEGKGLLFYCIGPTRMHAQILEMAFNMGADVNNVSSAGKSVFKFACEQATECENLCMRLLEKGADPNVADSATGCTALMEALRVGAFALARAILKRGGNPNAADGEQMHSAHIAAAKGFIEVLTMLSAYSADFNLTSSLGDTALHMAAAEGHAECCRFLFQRGCNVMIANQKKLLPSQIAEMQGHNAALKELQQAEKDLKSAKLPSISQARLHDWSVEHETVLRQAFQASSGAWTPVEAVSKETFVSILEEYNAPIDYNRLKTIINVLKVNDSGEIKIDDFFMGCGFLPSSYPLSSYTPTTLPTARPRSELNDTALISRDHLQAHGTEDPCFYFFEPVETYINMNRCVRTDDFELLRLAISQNIPVDHRDRFYKTPLMIACMSGKHKMALFLISSGANVNAHDHLKWTCLHHASLAGFADIIKLLLEHGAAVDATTSNGVTPLMRAIQSCKVNCVVELVNAGANIKATNKLGQNCAALALMYGNKEIWDLVSDKLKPAKICQAAQKGKTAPPVAKQGVKKEETTKVEKKACVIALNPDTTNHCITIPSITVWGRMVVFSHQVQKRQADRKKRLAKNEDILIVKPDEISRVTNPRQPETVKGKVSPCPGR